MLRAMLKEFRQFILRGNLVDLAVAVVIGAAFTAVVNALVKDLVTPLIAAVGGKHDFSTLAFTINGSRFTYGDFINALITLRGHRRRGVLPRDPAGQRAARPAAPGTGGRHATRACPECLSDDSRRRPPLRVLHGGHRRGGVGTSARRTDDPVRDERARQDSNLRPTAPEAVALSPELRARGTQA